MRRLIVILLIFTSATDASWAQKSMVDSLFNEVEVKVILDKEFYLSGTTVNAEILLLGFQNDLDYELTVNGQTTKVYNGKANYTVLTSGEGSRLIKGKVRYGKRHIYQTVEFEKEYTVAKGAAVFSLDEENTIYKGIGNPISIAVPGYPPHKVSVTAFSARLLKKGSFNYLIKAKEGAKNVTVNVTVKQNDNTLCSMGRAIFVVKNIPNLNLALNNLETNSTVKVDSLSEVLKEGTQLLIVDKNVFPISEIEVELQGFTFSIFKKKGDNPKPIKIQGNALTKVCIALIKNISQGDKIIIDAVEVNGSVEGVQANPLLITAK